MVPTAARWNTLATIERETAEHEAGHAAAAHLGNQALRIAAQAETAGHDEEQK